MKGLAFMAEEISVANFISPHEKNLYKFCPFDNLTHCYKMLHCNRNRNNELIMEAFQFTQTFQVRDYECDFQGIVNNSVYMNYLEHTRHEFAKEIGLDVIELAGRGINLVVVRAELDYKFPLRSGDTFLVGANMERASYVSL